MFAKVVVLSLVFRLLFTGIFLLCITCC